MNHEPPEGQGRLPVAPLASHSPQAPPAQQAPSPSYSSMPARRSAAVAMLLSVFWPGVGHLYLDHPRLGIGLMAVNFLVWSLTLALAGPTGAFLLWVPLAVFAMTHTSALARARV